MVIFDEDLGASEGLPASRDRPGICRLGSVEFYFRMSAITEWLVAGLATPAQPIDIFSAQAALFLPVERLAILGHNLGLAYEWYPAPDDIWAVRANGDMLIFFWHHFIPNRVSPEF